MSSFASWASYEKPRKFPSPPSFNFSSVGRRRSKPEKFVVQKSNFCRVSFFIFRLVKKKSKYCPQDPSQGICTQSPEVGLVMSVLGDRSPPTILHWTHGHLKRASRIHRTRSVSRAFRGSKKTRLERRGRFWISSTRAALVWINWVSPVRFARCSGGVTTRLLEHRRAELRNCLLILSSARKLLEQV